MRKTTDNRQDERVLTAGWAEHDVDWEYTGVTHLCAQCGHRFETAICREDYCPECGEAIAPGEH